MNFEKSVFANCLSIQEALIIDQQLFTVQHTPNVYLYYPNHGFTTPFNISGNILKIQAFKTNLPTVPVSFDSLSNSEQLFLAIELIVKKNENMNM